MTATLDEALAVQTDDAALAALLSNLSTAGADVAGFSPFSVSAQLPAQVASARVKEQSIRATLVKVLLGDYSEQVPKAWVTKMARAWWQVERIPASKARFLWPVTSASGTITMDSRTAIVDGTSCLFENVTPINVTAGTAQLVEFEARTAGTVGNIFTSSVVGFQVGSAGLSITDPAGSMIAAGRPEESNAALVARGRARFPSTSRAGNAAAFDYWIPTTVPSITRWAVDDTNPNGPGSTDIYIANAAGPALTSEIEALDAVLQAYRGKGTGPLRTFAAPEQTLTFGVKLKATSTAGVAAAATAAITDLQATVALGGGKGGRFYLDSVRLPLLAIPTVYEASFTGIAEETLCTPLAVLTLDATIEVVP